jgi:hypothetical protein
LSVGAGSTAQRRAFGLGVVSNRVIRRGTVGLAVVK